MLRLVARRGQHGGGKRYATDALRSCRGGSEVVPFFGATRELAPLMRPLKTLPASDSLVMSDGAVCCSS